MAEYAPDDRRGFYGSFLEVGTLAGFSLGASLMLGFSVLLGEGAMQEWGWRLPFLLAGPMGVIGLYLRSRIKDTPIYREADSAEAHRPAREPGLKPLARIIHRRWPERVAGVA